MVQGEQLARLVQHSLMLDMRQLVLSMLLRNRNIGLWDETVSLGRTDATHLDSAHRANSVHESTASG